MSLIGAMLAFATGIAARVRLPKPEVNADVEITKLKTELAAARLQVDVMRLAMMEARRQASRADEAYRWASAASQYNALQAQQAQMMQAQAQVQAMQNFHQGLLNYEGHCNCVPSRGQAFQQLGQVAGNVLSGLNDA